jgi:hypothetical protein
LIVIFTGEMILHYQNETIPPNINHRINKPVLKLCLAIFSSILFGAVNFSAMVHYSGHPTMNSDKRILLKTTKSPSAGIPKNSASLEQHCSRGAEVAPSGAWEE